MRRDKGKCKNYMEVLKIYLGMLKRLYLGSLLKRVLNEFSRLEIRLLGLLISHSSIFLKNVTPNPMETTRTSKYSIEVWPR